jgi:hypothetical protein
MGGKDLDSFMLFCDAQSCDNCHPNNMGYAYMAANVYKSLINPQPSGKEYFKSAMSEVGEEQIDEKIIFIE